MTVRRFLCRFKQRNNQVFCNSPFIDGKIRIQTRSALSKFNEPKFHETVSTFDIDHAQTIELNCVGLSGRIDCHGYECLNVTSNGKKDTNDALTISISGRALSFSHKSISTTLHIRREERIKKISVRFLFCFEIRWQK